MLCCVAVYEDLLHDGTQHMLLSVKLLLVIVPEFALGTQHLCCSV